MDLDKFFNLLAAIFGALGAIYVMLSVMAMSPDQMFQQAQTKWGFSGSQIEALASQKAENIAGFVFVIIAFLLAATTIIFVPPGIQIFKSTGIALSLAAVITGGLYASLYFMSQGIYRQQKLSIVRIPVSRYIDEVIKRGVVNDYDALQVPVYAKLLDLQAPHDETTRALLQLVASEVDKALPPDLDYSAIERPH